MAIKERTSPTKTTVTISKTTVERANSAMVSKYGHISVGPNISRKGNVALEGSKFTGQAIGRAFEAASRNLKKA